MAKNKLYSLLVSAGFFTGLGMILGHNLGDAASNTPLWIGGLLVLASAVLLGVRIGAGQNGSQKIEDIDTATK